MNNAATKMSTDLQKFMDKFQPRRFKLLDKGLDIRGVNNLHREITEAKAIIERMNLQLCVSHNAEMISYGGFEVNYI